MPKTGSYAIFVDPAASLTGSVTLNLHEVADLSGTVTTDGTPKSVTITTPGQNAAYTFSGTAGQRVSLVVSSNTVAVNCCVGNTLAIRKPDGATLASAAFGSSDWRVREFRT